jgi:broad specificity phosphatase PhoE
MNEIVFMRHGSTGVTQRFLGSSDVDLCETGKAQIAQLSASVRARDFDLVMSSPMKRCVQSCTALKLEEQVEYDQRLQEIDFGLWENEPFDEILAKESDLVKQWGRGDVQFRFPQGEKIGDFHERMEEVAASLNTLIDKKILLISHGGVIRHLICRLLNLSWQNYLLFAIDYAKFSTLQLYSEGGVLCSLNRERC